MQRGLDCYDPETRVFPKIRAEVRRGKLLSKREVLLIVRWKLGRIKDSNSITIKDENLAEVNRLVKDAAKSEEPAALQALAKIPGIGLATATAILTVCYPKKYTILDWRVSETLCLVSSIDSANAYLTLYLPRVRKRAKKWKCSLRDADRALWGLSVNRRLKRIIARS